MLARGLGGNRGLVPPTRGRRSAPARSATRLAAGGGAPESGALPCPVGCESPPDLPRVRGRNKAPCERGCLKQVPGTPWNQPGTQPAEGFAAWLVALIPGRGRLELGMAAACHRPRIASSNRALWTSGVPLAPRQAPTLLNDYGGLPDAYVNKTTVFVAALFPRRAPDGSLHALRRGVRVGSGGSGSLGGDAGRPHGGRVPLYLVESRPGPRQRAPAAGSQAVVDDLPYQCGLRPQRALLLPLWGSGLQLRLHEGEDLSADPLKGAPFRKAPSTSGRC